MSEEAISRRTMIVGAAAIVPIAAIRAAAQTPANGLAPDQLKLLDAFTDRLVPNDENGPGASELGAANYINRVLADTIANEKPMIISGLEATNALAQKSHGKPFLELAPDDKDAVLTEIERTPATRPFFARVRRLTLEGCFSDPYYGGNRGFAGWDLIGYPGPRLAVAPDDQKMHVTIKPTHISAWGGVKDGH